MKRRNSIKLALQRGASRAFVLVPLAFVLVAGAGCPSLFESPAHRSAKIKQAEPGKDLAKTVTSTSGEIVNGYAALAANVAANATSLTYTGADAIFGTLAKGDLLLIAQMQGATIDTVDSVSYGAVADLGGAGLYEFVGVEGVTAATSTITVACPLKHAYTTAGKTQLIRVPQYTTLTINSGASIIPQTWNGTRGGIVAVHATTVNLNGSIDASAQGFRGGPKHDTTSSTGQPSPFASSTATAGAEKGESIAGFGAAYGVGRYGRGAPANGGGGGDPHNGGGGGGANAGLIAGWTQGLGVAAGWTNTTGYHACADTAQNPWRMDPNFTTCAAWSYEGGGRGGYSWSNQNADAVTVGPNDAAWDGDLRRITGGLGGRPLTSGVATRLFVGGGGGAGDGNNDNAGPGGIGGGMVFVIAGSVAGSGSLLANGGAGGDDETGGDGDAGGGGGGGGTVVVNAASIASTVNIRANGGSGGRNLYAGSDTEVEGPGGGGGGGYIAVSGGTPNRQANGGPAGLTRATSALSEFQENGATAGHAGIIDGSASGLLYCGILLVTTIATHPDNPTNDKTGDFTFTNTTAGVTYQCKLDNGSFASCTASYTTPELADGSHTLTVQATDSIGNVEPNPPTFTWVIDTVAPDTTIVTRPGNPSTTAVGSFTFGVTGETGPVTYACKLDAGSFTACTATYTTPALANGEHTLSVQATDAAGNTDTTPATYTWVIAATGPVTTLATKPANPTNDKTGDFTFTNSKTPVTYECKLDAADWAACTASYTTPELDDGQHTLSVRSTDASNVLESPVVTYTWIVDTLPPDTTIPSKPSSPSASVIGTFTFESSQFPATFECRLDGGAWAACGSSYTTPVLSNGSHTLDVQAKDAAGNVDPTPATYTWEVNALSLDGGVLDGGATEAGGIDLGPIVIIDAGPVIDTQAIDGPAIDVTPDLPGPDLAPPVVDVGADRPVDVALDAYQPAEVGQDRPPSGPETGPDTAPVADPPPDVAAPPVNEDAAITPPVTPEIEYLGGGFCAISPARTASPLGLALLAALAGLALLRRRRR